MKKILLVLLTLLLTLPVTGFAQVDDKFDRKLTDQELKDFKDNAKSLRIDEKTQEKLIKKLQKGKMLDSDNPKKYSDEIRAALEVSAEEPIKEYTFDDGSKVVVSVTEEKTQREEAVFGILATSCGTGYCNFTSYKVQKETLTANVSFKADFTLVYGHQYADRITDVWDENASVIGGKIVGYPSLSITRGTEVVGGSNALAKLTFTYENFNSSGSTDVELRLYVGRDTYSVSGINF